MAIRRALPISVANWRRLLTTITSAIYSATKPDIIALGEQRLYQGEARRRLQALINALDATREAYIALGRQLEWDLDEAVPQAPFARYVDELDTVSSCQFPFAVDAVRQAALQVMETVSGPKTGSPKKEVIRTAVRQLLDIFERATGLPPTIYWSPYDGYRGNAYAFVEACLAPWCLVPRKCLGSPILVAYREGKAFRSK